MESQIENYPDISFISDISLNDYLNMGKQWYIDRYKELTDEDIELYDTDEEKIMLDTVGYMFYTVAQYIDNAGKQNLLKYSESDFLDNIGARCGVQRTEATPASVAVRFKLSEAQTDDYTIPEGTQIAPTESEDIYFETSADAIIPAGEMYTDITCTCLTPGEAGNGFTPGEITELVDTLAYIETIENITTSDGGVDAEDDDSLAERIFLAPSIYSTTGTEDSYKYHAMSASALVNDVVVYSPAPCEVEVIITSKNSGVPSDELINIVTAYLSDSKRKTLTDKVTVRGPDTKAFSIDMTYYIDLSNQKYAEKIKEQVEAAVDEYIAWQTQKIGRNVTPSKLIQLVMEAGAKRVSITSPDDITIESHQIAVLGSKNITYGGIEDE